jgi:hypothetical protein
MLQSNRCDVLLNSLSFGVDQWKANIFCSFVVLFTPLFAESNMNTWLGSLILLSDMFICRIVERFRWGLVSVYTKCCVANVNSVPFWADIEPYFTWNSDMISWTFRSPWKYWPMLYEGLSRSFRTGCLEREMQMVRLSATRCSCIATLWVSLVSFAAITLCVASQRVFVVVSVYFVIDSVRKIWLHPRTSLYIFVMKCYCPGLEHCQSHHLLVLQARNFLIPSCAWSPCRAK